MLKLLSILCILYLHIMIFVSNILSKVREYCFVLNKRNNTIPQFPCFRKLGEERNRSLSSR